MILLFLLCLIAILQQTCYLKDIYRSNLMLIIWFIVVWNPFAIYRLKDFLWATCWFGVILNFFLRAMIINFNNMNNTQITKCSVFCPKSAKFIIYWITCGIAWICRIFTHYQEHTGYKIWGWVYLWFNPKPVNIDKPTQTNPQLYRTI